MARSVLPCSTVLCCSPASLLDVLPTALDWLGLPFPPYSIFRQAGRVRLSGRSLLPHLGPAPQPAPSAPVFASQTMHEASGTDLIKSKQCV